MPGNHVYIDMASARVVSLAVNQLGIASIFGKQYESDFNDGRPIGDTLRVKLPHRSNIREGLAYQGQSIDRRYVNVVADQIFGADLDYDTIEKAIQMERTPEELDANLFRPVGQQIAQEIDSRAALYAYKNTNNITGQLGTTPTTLSVYTGARTRIKENGGWETASRVGAFITPEMMGTIVAGSSSPALLSLFVKDVDKAFRKGYIGEYGDMTWFESMSLYRHTTGVITTQATGTTVSGGGQTGTTLNLGGSTGDTILAGDTITIANVFNVNPLTRRSTNRLKHFKVMTGCTFAASLGTVTIFPGIVPAGPYQNVDSVPATAAIVLLTPGTTMTDATAKSGLFGAVLTNESYALVGIDLPMPKASSQEWTDSYRDEKTGIGISCWRFAEGRSRTWSTRWDVMLGFGPLFNDNSACLIGSLN